MVRADEWEEAKNVLCVRLDGIGDVLMTTPAIRALRQARPDRRVTLLTSSAGARIASLIREIDEVIVYDAPWLKATHPRRNSRPELEMAERLEAQGFDAAVIFTVYSQSPLPSAFLCYLANIPLRLAHCRENPYQLLTHWVAEVEPERFQRHEVRRQLDLVASIGCRTEDERLGLHVPAHARACTHRLLRRLGIGADSPWVLIHPGATAASRRYPPESYAEVARRLVNEYGLSVVFSGDESERGLVDGIRRAMGVNSYTMAGELDIAQFTALVELAPLLISNNTGPVHIAAAVGTPVVDLYALTNPQHQPWQVPNRVLYHDVPCRYCYKSVCPEGHHNCLRLVSPDMVVQAAMELLDETSVPSTALASAL